MARRFWTDGKSFILDIDQHDAVTVPFRVRRPDGTFWPLVGPVRCTTKVKVDDAAAVLDLPCAIAGDDPMRADVPFTPVETATPGEWVMTVRDAGIDQSITGVLRVRPAAA